MSILLLQLPAYISYLFGAELMWLLLILISFSFTLTLRRNLRRAD